jgi:hypothetical protein
MSLVGKGSGSFRKKDVQEQRNIALGFKKIRFAHKATLGDSTIPLTSLVLPTEMSTNGFVNPNASEMARAQLNLYRNNLKLVSSLKGLLVDQLSYVVSSSSTITFLGFTAEDGEIFTGWLDEAPTTTLTVVDGSPIVASGILAAGQTDFNIGTPIPINSNPSMQIGSVMAFADRGLQYRKVGNVVSGDGDYYEVPVAGGLGSILRFNASGSDRFITVVSNGVVAERPDGSMTAMIERVQGQIDAMVPTLAAVSGLPTTTFQTAPNNVNLKQFGDQLVANDALDVVQNTRLGVLENNFQTGTFTLSPAFGTSNGSATVTAQSCTYVKIGKLVWFNAGFTITKGSATGSFGLSGLPFTSTSNVYTPNVYLNDGALATSTSSLLFAGVSGTSISIVRSTILNYSPTAVLDTDLPASRNILITGTYQTT